MYDRYTIASTKELLENTFQVKLPEEYVRQYNAVPTKRLPIITVSDPKNSKLCYWGLSPHLSNNKAISMKLYNLSAFSAFQRPLYRKLLEKNRCIILADGFYIWKQLSKKQKVPYFCYFNNRIPFGIAGVWEEYEDLDGNISENFNMLTVTSTHEPRQYQEDMPAILNGELISQWLNKDLRPEQLEQLLKKIDADGIRTHAVSPLIANNKINDDRLIKPATPSDQFGNYTLFS